MSQREGYSATVAGGYAGDALAQIQRRYFKRYPIDLPHSIEPTPEFLASVDDDAPDPEIQEPNEDELSPDEYATAKEGLQERRKLLAFRKAVSYT